MEKEENYKSHPIDSQNRNWHVTKEGKESLARYNSYNAAEAHAEKLGKGYWTKHGSDMKEHEKSEWGNGK